MHLKKDFLKNSNILSEYKKLTIKSDKNEKALVIAKLPQSLKHELLNIGNIWARSSLKINVF